MHKHQCFIQFRHIFFFLGVFSLVACGGGGSDSGNGDANDVLAAPQNVLAVAADTQITLSWDAVANATAYDICHATETITQPASCSVHLNGVLAVDQASPAVISGLTNDTAYFYVVIPKNANGDGIASAVVSATPIGPVLPTPTGQLNDTGITLCGDYAFGGSESHQNDLDCNLTADAEGDPIPPGQDAVSGRDANTASNTDSDGHKGFSFSKIDSNGFALTDQTSTTFSCVKDNVTGLIWEVKQETTGLHSKNDRYTWFNSDAATNGGESGTLNDNASCEGNAANICNTQAYVARVNIASLCGATNWRMPTRKELRSLVSYDRSNPVIDTTYFPNTASSSYWSSSPYAPNSIIAWGVSFNLGFGNVSVKSFNDRVRLVRSGQ